MYCKECGNKIVEGDRYCTKCGKDVALVKGEDVKKTSGDRRKAVSLVIVTALITSAFWTFILRDSGDYYSANIISHLLETVGRQGVAWGKNEQMIDLIGSGLSDDCLATPGCTDDAVSQITTLRAEIDKEREEIGNLWSETGIINDFGQYFSKLDYSDKTKIQDMMQIYFPDETKDINTTSNQLL